MLPPCGDRQLLGDRQTLGQFALVSYIPDPLAGFLDRLRLDLTPGCSPRAHVTILPPRPLSAELKDAVAQIAHDTRKAPSFRVDLGNIEIFPGSNVVYLGIARGEEQLRQLYIVLNSSSLRYKEPFAYHPHITIAQNISATEAADLARRAQEAWRNYDGPRGFQVESLSFVQHVAPAIWTDVKSVPLGVEVPLALQQ